MLDENRSDGDLRKLMYDRLYPSVTYCETMEGFLKTIGSDSADADRSLNDNYDVIASEAKQSTENYD